MKLHKIFKLALNMVLHSKLRSWLTIIGIVIGVASVVGIMGLSQGLEASVTSSFGDLGADIITISPGYSKSTNTMGSGRLKNPSTTSSASQDPLTNKDVQALKTIPDIQAIDTRITGSVDGYFMGGEGSLTVTGVVR